MRNISMLFVLWLLSLKAFAGNITGAVLDEKTGEAIIGATVLVRESSNGTVTDVNGGFTLKVSAGIHTLQVKYLGYQTKEVEGIEVKADETVIVKIMLNEDDATQLNEVVVRSSLRKENIIALYAIQKNSIAVSSGISADIIQRSPDKNTGEVLKRVSGASIQSGKFVIIRGLSERYNAALINGAQMQSTEPDRKAFSYDVIPSNLIDNIIINKTASADLPGDFAGGIVQVLTKDVPDNNFFNAGVSMSYNNQTTFKNVNAADRSFSEYIGLRNNKQALPEAFGSGYKYYKGLTSDQRFTVAKQLKGNYEQEAYTALPNMSVQLSAGDVRNFKNGNRLGAVVGLSYRSGYNQAPDFYRATWNEDATSNSYSKERWTKFTASVSGLANFAYLTDKSKFSFRNMLSSIHDDVNFAREGFSFGTGNFTNLYATAPLDRQMFSSQLDGEHAIGQRNIKINWGLNYSLLFTTQYDLRSVGLTQPGIEGNRMRDTTTPQIVNERSSRRFFSDLTDHSYSGNLSSTIPFMLFGQKQSFKFGYLASGKYRAFNARIFQYRPGTEFNNEAVRSYELIFHPDYINEKGYELEEQTNATDQYEATAILHGGFLMLDNHFGERWRFSWGVRYESYTQRLIATNMSGSRIDKATLFDDLLPSMNLSYSPAKKSKIRFSASRTVNRPEFREIAPFMFVDFENNWQVIGDTNLVRSNITNFDVRYEYYPSSGEAITMGVFYKYFENPIESRMDDQSNLDLLIYSYKNAPAARVFGAEADVRKNLSFISDEQWLKNFTLGANVTYVHSKVSVDDAGFGMTDARPLQGQSPYLINLSALYNDPSTGIGISVLYNRIGERLYIVGNRDIRSTWEKSRDVLDLQISKALLNRRAELKLTISDLLNQDYIFYWNYDNKNSYSASDRVFQKYRLGTTFTVGFSYRF